MTISCRKLVISGRVHRVGYRYWLRQTAQALGVTGWVRNLADGTVEALVCGIHDQIDELIRQCHEGPLFAKVADVEVASVSVPAQGEAEASSFVIR